jgi:DNA-binding response OmpR family regulator
MISLVMMLSASAEHEHVCRAYALGVDSFVRKPLDAGDLLSVAAHLKNYWLEMSPA